jgi:hypothetical protein
MVEAKQSLLPRPSYVLITLARQAAKQAVKQRLRDQCLKPQLMRAREINAAAEVYFDEHARELLEEAWRKVQGCPDLMNREGLICNDFRCANVRLKMGS